MSVTDIILLVFFALIITAMFVFPFISKNAKKLLPPVSTAATTISLSAEAIATLSAAFPSAKLDTISSILNWATAGAKAAEQLYKTGDIDADERKRMAQDFVYKSLRLVGVSVTDDVVSLVSNAIEAAVNDLPKTHSEE